MKRFDTAKLAMAMFIASEAVFFGCLIAAYVYYSGATTHGPNANNSLDPVRTSIFTACLIASSGTVWLAERRRAVGRRNAFRVLLGATIFLGCVFLAGQVMEYVGLIAKSVTPERNLFGASFFTLTGFHGLHVLCGIIALAILLAVTWGHASETKQRSGAAAISMYWHFVDAVWIVIFSLVYLPGLR